MTERTWRLEVGHVYSKETHIRESALLLIPNIGPSRCIPIAEPMNDAGLRLFAGRLADFVIKETRK